MTTTRVKGYIRRGGKVKGYARKGAYVKSHTATVKPKKPRKK